MRIQQFLEHHGIQANPFADEDAQTDLVFKSACIRTTYHPAWDKIYGDPAEPATAVVFGEKGSGKTALRLQMVQHLADYNANHPQSQVFVVCYDDFNPFLDRLRERFSGRRRRADRVLGQWRLWDHMDAVLSLAVTQLVDRLLDVRQARHPAARDEPLDPSALDAAQRRDVLLLAACYDQSLADSRQQRFGQLRRRLQFPVWKAWWDIGLGAAVSVAVLLLVGGLGRWDWLAQFWSGLLILLVVLGGWGPRLWRWLKWSFRSWHLARNARVLNHQASVLRRALMKFPAAQIAGQPLPDRQRTDDRYELLAKLQGVMRGLKFHGLIVLVDRVDEPYLITGSVELMRALVWPLLDNKFLKHPGLGLKLLLPAELERLLDREDRDFHQRARLDKQNLIRSLAWTGQSLYDLANARLKACALEGNAVALDQLFDAGVGKQRLVGAFEALRVPRHLFKFMYRLLTAHCNAHSEDRPVWQIDAATFESVLALYQRDREAFERGEGPG